MSIHIYEELPVLVQPIRKPRAQHKTIDIIFTAFA